MIVIRLLYFCYSIQQEINQQDNYTLLFIIFQAKHQAKQILLQLFRYTEKDIEYHLQNRNWWMDKIKHVSYAAFNQQFIYKQMIDSGSFGFVFRYRRAHNDQNIAVKILKDEEGLDGLIKEVNIMNEVKHENILICYGIYYITSDPNNRQSKWERNKYAMVMEFCHRGNLKQNLKEIQLFPQKDKIWICVQISRGLLALHQKNIMHRDIKPANILFNENWVVKICDFGFGRYDDSDLQKTVAVGTPIYRDPNVNKGQYTKKCDIYSVGLVFDTIFRGGICFKRVDSAEAFKKQQISFQQNKVNIIAQLKCCQQIKDIILSCLKRSEYERIDARMLVDKLEQIYQKFDPTFMTKQKIRKIDLQLKEEKEAGQSTKWQVIKLAKQKQEQQIKLKQKEKQKQIVKKSQTLIIANQQQENYKYQDRIFLTEKTSCRSKQIKKVYPIVPIKPFLSSNCQFQIKLLATRAKIDLNISQNLQVCGIYSYFLAIDRIINRLNQIDHLSKMEFKFRKIIKFLVILGYILFLKIHRLFFQKKQSPITAIPVPIMQQNSKQTDQQKNIQFSKQRISNQKLSQDTINICLQHILQRNDQFRQIIKPLLQDLYLQKSYYNETEMRQSVKKIITTGVQDKFTDIQKYNFKSILDQINQIMKKSCYLTKSHFCEQKEKIAMAFLNDIHAIFAMYQ